MAGAVSALLTAAGIGGSVLGKGGSTAIDDVEVAVAECEHDSWATTCSQHYPEVSVLIRTGLSSPSLRPHQGEALMRA